MTAGPCAFTLSRKLGCMDEMKKTHAGIVDLTTGEIMDTQRILHDRDMKQRGYYSGTREVMATQAHRFVVYLNMQEGRDRYMVVWTESDRSRARYSWEPQYVKPLRVEFANFLASDSGEAYLKAAVREYVGNVAAINRTERGTWVIDGLNTGALEQFVQGVGLSLTPETFERLLGYIKEEVGKVVPVAMMDVIEWPSSSHLSTPDDDEDDEAEEDWDDDDDDECNVIL